MRSRSNELPACDWLVLLHYLDGRSEIYRTDGTFDEAVAFGSDDLWPITAAIGMTVLAGNSELATKIDEHGYRGPGGADGEAAGGFDPGAFGIERKQPVAPVVIPEDPDMRTHEPDAFTVGCLFRNTADGLHEQVRRAMERCDLVLILYGPTDGGYPTPLHEEGDVIADAITDTGGKVLLHFGSWGTPEDKAVEMFRWANHHAEHRGADRLDMVVYHDREGAAA